MELQVDIRKSVIVCFTLYGMRYRYAVDANGITETFNQGDKLEYIALSKELQGAVNELMLTSTTPDYIAVLERIAIRAMQAYFKSSTKKIKYIGKPTILSTRRGSIMILTEYGYLLGVALRHPSDIFVVKSVMSRFKGSRTWAEVGSIMYAILSDKISGIALNSVKDGVAEFVSTESPEYYYATTDAISMYNLATQHNLTIWRISYEQLANESEP